MHPWAAKSWSVLYDDGSVYSSHQGPPESAPVDGVLVIVEWLYNGAKKVHNKADYYLWSGEHWCPLSERELDVHLRRLLPQLKFGRWAMPSVFYRALDKATQAKEE